MLALKKISSKKLTIYVAIMVLMLAGTGFMLFQNQRLTNRKSTVIDNPARYDKFISLEAIGPGSSAASKALLTASPQASAKPEQPLQPVKNSGIDVTIFSSGKYKELRENALVIQTSSGLGKRDPFKPN